MYIVCVWVSGKKERKFDLFSSKEYNTKLNIMKHITKRRLNIKNKYIGDQYLGT